MWDVLYSLIPGLVQHLSQYNPGTMCTEDLGYMPQEAIFP